MLSLLLHVCELYIAWNSTKAGMMHMIQGNRIQNAVFYRLQAMHRQSSRDQINRENGVITLPQQRM